jgi:hypothetical protein
MKLLFTLLLLTHTLSFSQGFSKYDSLIYLDEVIINANSNLINIKTLKTKGKQNVSFTMKNKGKIISLVENIPSGKIKTVIFFFNNNTKKVYKDVEFRLVIYSVDNNNKPDKELFNNDFRFLVKNSDKGNISLDLSKLNILNYKNLFFGLELLKNSDSNDFQVDLNSAKNNNTFIQMEGMENWFKKQGSELKTEIIIQTK